MTLVLNPVDESIQAFPTLAATPLPQDAWSFDLSANVPDGVQLRPGESTAAKTLRFVTPNSGLTDFVPSVLTTAAPNARPEFSSTPIERIPAGQRFSYDVDATDPDGNEVVYILHQGPTGMTVDSQSGLVQWQTDYDSAAENNVAIIAIDSRGGHAVQAWTLVVAGGNRAPRLIAPPADVVIAENQTLQVAIEAFDPDGDAVRIWTDHLPAGAFFDSDQQAIRWSPGSDSAGTYDDLKIFASDGVNTTTHSFDVSVSKADRPPSIATIPPFTLREGDRWTYQIEASDPDGDPLRFVGNDLPQGATLDSNSGLLRWDVGFNAAGSQTLSFSVIAGAAEVQGQVHLDVLNANGAPRFENHGERVIEEGQTIEVKAFAFDPDDPGFKLPTRLDDGSLEPAGLVSPVAYSATGLPDGASFDPETATLTWTPDYDQSGSYTVHFEAVDDGGGTGKPITVTAEIPIFVRDVNRPPVVREIDRVTIEQRSLVDIPVTASDPDGDDISLRASSGSPRGVLPSFVTFTDHGNGTGVFHIAPTPLDRGDFVLSLAASDDGNGSGRGSIKTDRYDFVLSVTSENAAPVLHPIPSVVVLPGDLLRLPIRSTDIDLETLTYTVGGLPGNARIVAGGPYGTALLNWEPTVGDLGLHDVVVTVTDSGIGDASAALQSSRQFSVNVRQENRTPSLEIPADVAVSEGETLTLPFLASDPDGDPIHFFADVLPEGSNLDLDTGRFVWTPSFDQAGFYSVDISASDGASSATKTMAITVAETNRPPVLAHPGPQFTFESQLLEFRVAGGDFDGGRLELSVTNLPAGAQFDVSSGLFRWQPAFDQSGRWSINFTLTDQSGLSDSIDVPIVVINTNRVPVLDTRHHQVVVGQHLDVRILATDSDVDDVLSFAAFGLPPGAQLDSETGRISWLPDPSSLGDFYVDVRVNDGIDEAQGTMLLSSVSTPRLPDLQVVTTPSFPALPGQTVRVQVIADGFAPIDSVQLFHDGQPLDLDASGSADIVAEHPGKTLLLATATDLDGHQASLSKTLRVRDPSDNVAPELSLSIDGVSRQHRPVITESTELIASVDDTNLDFWQLSVTEHQDSIATILTER